MGVQFTHGKDEISQNLLSIQQNIALILKGASRRFIVDVVEIYAIFQWLLGEKYNVDYSNDNDFLVVVVDLLAVRIGSLATAWYLFLPLAK